MNFRSILLLAATLAAGTGLALAQAAAPSTAAESPAETAKLPGWGTPVNPAEDCKFNVSGEKLHVLVPGSKKPHDLGAELGSMNGPRVLQPISGDFVLQVRVDGEFQPGDESTEQARTGYTGAGLVVFADEKNYVRIERATLHSSGDVEHPYTNFEIRVNAEVQRFGSTGDLPTVDGKPTWLRLERVGNQMLGSMSQDGVHWNYGQPKDLPEDIWNKGTVQAGVAAVSTSPMPFEPKYSEFSLKKPTQVDTERQQRAADPKDPAASDNVEPK